MYWVPFLSFEIQGDVSMVKGPQPQYVA